MPPKNYRKLHGKDVVTQFMFLEKGGKGTYRVYVRENQRKNPSWGVEKFNYRFRGKSGTIKATTPIEVAQKIAKKMVRRSRLLPVVSIHNRGFTF